MFCPNCGNKITADQKFCRSCGLSLEKITQVVTEQLPVKPDESIEERKERLERWGFYALCVFGAGVLLPLLYYIGTLLVAGKVLTGLGLLAFIVVVGCGLLSVILFAQAEDIKKAGGKGRSPQTGELTEQETTSRLLPESNLTPASSITDRTTELLFVEKEGRAKDI